VTVSVGELRWCPDCDVYTEELDCFLCGRAIYTVPPVEPGRRAPGWIATAARTRGR
jgi:hypothetical protein